MKLSRLAKVFGFIAVFLLSSAPRSEAADLALAWDPATDGITTGYVLSYGVAPGMHSQQVNVGFTTSHTLFGLADGVTYYISVAAYNANGVASGWSNEVS